jgi:xanthine dehydrogenase large subunit
MRKLIKLPSTVSSTITGKVGASQQHESSEKHVSGQAIYIDDRPLMANQLHGAIGQSTIAHGLIKSMDLSKVKSAPGVVAVLVAADVPGQLDIAPVFDGDPVLVSHRVEFMGQALFAVAATSHQLAVKAARLAMVEYQEFTPLLLLKDAVAQQSFVRPLHTQRRGDAATAINRAMHVLAGQLTIGGQEHFYLEGQVSTAEPTEDGGMNIYTSSQHPSEVQITVAQVLNIPLNKVVVDMRRMGGGFGGKETQAAAWACIAALLANKTARCVKVRLNRQDDMILTGKRHPFETDYRVGFDDNGRLKGIEINLNANCGYSADLSDAVVDRAMFHCDNAYFLGHARVVGNRCKTNTVSNTAFRGFGGPQGMLAIEGVMDDIARKIGKDPLIIRKLNLYGQHSRNVTHYGQTVEHNIVPMMIDKLETDCGYQQRRAEISQFNKKNKLLKKGIALTPVKFGISFTLRRLNQAGALIHIYSDGTIALNHGGTEMGQGLYTKVAQVVAQEFQVDIDNIQVTAARTDKVPNTSPTAASSSSDLNGKAAQNAAKTLRQRLIDFASGHFNVKKSQVIFCDNQIHIGQDKLLSFAELIQLAYINRVALSATGFYKTPKLHYNRDKGSGHPFFYFANGVGCSEVLIDTLTGEYKVTRVDILQDVGESINPALDRGQIEGAFIQGMGWLTTEELVWSDKGQLMTSGPATYKIPTISDMPQIFNVELLANAPNREATIYHSKAVGEPPLMLAISVWSALRDAIASVSDYQHSPQLDTPVTPERVLKAVQQMQSRQ